MINNKIQSRIGKAFAHLFFIILSIVCVAPIVLIISISLSDNGEILKNGYSFLPRGFNLDAYKYLLLDYSKILQAYKITLISTVFGTLGSMLCTILLAYVISRKNFKYARVISFLIFFTMLFHAGMFPGYLWATKYLHLRDNILVLIIPGFVSAWNVMLMRSFFLGIPDEITEAATIDGSNNYGILFKMVLPLSKAAIATVGLFTILSYFNNWQSSMLFMTDSSKISIQYFLYKTMNNIAEAQKNPQAMLSFDSFPQEPVRMAIAVVSVLPVVIVFPFLQKYFVRGITLGSVKG